MKSDYMCTLGHSRVGNDSYTVDVGKPKCVKILDMEHVDLSYIVPWGRIGDITPVYETVATFKLTGGNMDVNYSCSGVLYGKDHAAIGCWLV